MDIELEQTRELDEESSSKMEISATAELVVIDNAAVFLSKGKRKYVTFPVKVMVKSLFIYIGHHTI
jgi:hypothetical protein